MCINLETSIVSFLIGTLSGTYLILKDNIKPEKKVIGYFMICISLVQLLEAGLYYFNQKEYNVLIRLLAICLGLQGFVIYYFSKKMLKIKISNILYYVVIFISIAITIIALNSNFAIDKKSKCLNWSFIDKNKYIADLLFVMYLSIGLLLLKTRTFRIYAIMLAITYIISYMIKPLKNSPSAWCISSAVISPLMIWLG